MPDRPSLADVTRGRGLLFGGDYNPEQWAPHVWREDVALMRAAGVNLVTVGVFSWARLQPEPDRFDLDWLREVIDLLHEGGIAVDLATPTASPPPWLGALHPETLPVTADGVRLSWGSRNQFSASSPAYRTSALEVSRAVVDAFVDHPGVVMWHVGNELGQVDHSDVAAASFRRWLERRYGSVEALNAAWETTVWSQRYRSFDEVLPPRAAPYHRNPSQDLDFRRFTSDELLDLYRAQVGVIRERDDRRPVTTNFMGFFHLADYFSWAGDVDVVADDAYPDPGDPRSPADAALTQDLMRSLGGGAPWLLMESATSAVSWRPHNLTVSPAASRRASLQAVAHGADGVCFFQWRQARSGPERFHSAMLPVQGVDTAVHRGVRALGADLARLASVAGQRTTAQVALVWDWPSWWAASAQAMPTDRLDPLATLRAWHQILWDRRIAVDVVPPTADLSGYRAVLAPSSYVMTEADADRVREYVAAGGRYVLGPFSGVADEGAHLHLGPFPAPVRDVLGVAGQEWVPLPDGGVPARWADGERPSFRVETWAEHTAATGAEPVVLLSAAPGAEQLSGAVAVARQAHGSGAAWYDGPWGLEFVDAGGRVLTRSMDRSVGLVTTADGTFVRDQLTMGVAETIYGLGERFGTFAKNGQVVDIWNADGGTASEQAYKNVPFYLSDAGYGLFVAHPEHVSFEIGSEVVSRVQFSVPGEELQYYVVHGATPKEILERYTALTGRPARVPAWTYGLWLSTSFTTSYDEKTVTSFVDGMAERDLPLSVFHFDCFWMRQFHWSDFQWDPAMFPDPRGMLERLKAKGLRICVWINPYIAQRSVLFEEGRRLGHLVTRPDGSVWQWDLWQAGMALVDFTSPAAVAWYQEKLEALLDDGVDCFKTDFGERIPTEVVYADGSDPQRMHNYYTQLYNKAVFDLLERKRGTGEAVLFARSATTGGQQFPVHWGGDCESTFVAMAESLRGGLSLGMSGFGYWSHDIGGFEGTPDPAVFKRWVAFGLLSSHSRLHGSNSYRVPWAFDEEAVDVTRAFTRLKLSLMPYLGAAGAEAATTGVPVMRAMALEYPGDRGVAGVGTQYSLGGSLVVAPVFSAEGDVDVYLPAVGRWTHLLTGEVVEGVGWRHERHGFDSLPLYVRPGTVLPVGANRSTPEYAWADGVTLRLFELPDGFDEEVHVPGGTGAAASFRVVRSGDEVRVTTDDAPGEWAVALGVAEPTVTGTGRGELVLDVASGD